MLPERFTARLTERLRAIRAQWQAARTFIRDAYTTLDQSTDGLAGHLVRGWQRFSTRGPRQAAALAYFSIFSLFPLSLLVVGLISQVAGEFIAREQVLSLLQSFIPAEFTALIQENVLLALEQSSGLSVVALIGLIWSALSLFSHLTASIDDIFHPTEQRSVLVQRVLALAIVFTLGLLLIVSFLTTVAFRLLSLLLLDRVSDFIRAGAIFIPLGLNVAMFALLLRYVPRGRIYWDAVWPAALVGGIGWELLKSGFVWFLENLANFSVIYGSLGTVIALLLWAYLSAWLLLLSAELCAAINTWINVKQERFLLAASAGQSVLSGEPEPRDPGDPLPAED